MQKIRLSDFLISANFFRFWKWQLWEASTKKVSDLTFDTRNKTFNAYPQDTASTIAIQKASVSDVFRKISPWTRT